MRGKLQRDGGKAGRDGMDLGSDPFRRRCHRSLSGASLFGGLGLVILNCDPYLYPLVTGAIIFLAVLLDIARTRARIHLGRRAIRLE